MIRKITFVILIFIFSSVFVFAAEETAIPKSIGNNEYHLESIRLKKLAQDTYDSGDYDASAGFAQEAIRFALLSDEYVSGKLIAEAERLKVLAEKSNIIERFPENYNDAVNYYENAVVFHSNEEWNESIPSAIKAIEIFGVFATTGALPAAGTGTRPPAAAASGQNQYTVRTWRVEKDCLWNIAGYAWVYGDPWKWRRLYEANKSKMPDPNNPDLIEPGMVLDIPR